MDGEYAKPGDIVELKFLVFSGDYDGKQVTVVERPVDRDYGDEPGDIWFWWHLAREHQWVGKESYKIIKAANSGTTQSKDVDKSLKRQLNDNLRGLFGFD